MSFRCFLFAALLVFTPGQLCFAAPATDPTTTILVLGDSLVAGYGLAEHEAFPAQLEAALNQRGHQVNVLNAGVSGDTSAGGLRRLGWALAVDPDVMILALGANDALRALDPDQTRANLAAIIRRATRDNIAVLLAGMKAPRNLGSSYYTRFDRIYPELAADFDLDFYPFFLAGVATDPDLNQSDGLHPTATGVSKIVGQMLPYVEKLLTEINRHR